MLGLCTGLPPTVQATGDGKSLPKGTLQKPCLFFYWCFMVSQIYNTSLSEVPTTALWSTFPFGQQRVHVAAEANPEQGSFTGTGRAPCHLRLNILFHLYKKHCSANLSATQTTFLHFYLVYIHHLNMLCLKCSGWKEFGIKLWLCALLRPWQASPGGSRSLCARLPTGWLQGAWHKKRSFQCHQTSLRKSRTC